MNKCDICGKETKGDLPPEWIHVYDFGTEHYVICDICSLDMMMGLRLRSIDSYE